ncbi:hypothetical protein ACP70R_023552 [Stipagrostis hirtigluma subsp. patula]
MNDEERPDFFYGSTNTLKKDDEERPDFLYGSDTKENDLKGTNTFKRDDKERPDFFYGSHTIENNLKATNTLKKATDDEERPDFFYGSYTKKNDLKAPNTLKKARISTDDEERPDFFYGSHTKVNDLKAPNTLKKGDEERPDFLYGSHTKENDLKATNTLKKDDEERPDFFYGSQTKENGLKATDRFGKADDEERPDFFYGSHTKENVLKAIDVFRKVDDKKRPDFFYGSNMKENDLKATYTLKKDDMERPDFNYGPNIDMNAGETMKQDNEERPDFYYGPRMKGADKKACNTMNRDNDERPDFYYGSHLKGNDIKASNAMKQGGHLHSSNHRHFNFTKFLFSEDVLSQGTILSPCIPPATSFAPFLRHEEANSIPLSTRKFNDILAMFAPASLTMARNIWYTLDMCEHSHPLPGEKQACVTSLDSMVDFAMSTLGTKELHAISSYNVPIEGVESGSRKYKVLSSRRVTNAAMNEETTMICHGMAFPYAIFYCHAINATKVYEVMLQGVQDVQSTMTMRAIVMCHLDTTLFDPNNQFFVERGIKPGDAPVCHFVRRDDILWMPSTSTKGHVLNL